MRVYDLCPFFNELALYELRQDELRPIVDVFGLVELPRTFTDLPKPLYATEAKLNARIYVPPAYPSGPHPTIDWFQRAQLGKLAHDAEPDDIIMYSDVDEIPDPNVVKRLIAAGISEPLCLQSKLYYHRVDLYDPSGPWSGTIIGPARLMGDAQALRHRRCVLPQIPDAGWHFSWLGGAHQIAEKLLAVDIERDSNDTMHNPGQDIRFLQSCYDTGKDLFGRPQHNKVRVPIIPGVNQPNTIIPWLAMYPQYAAVDAVAY